MAFKMRRTSFLVLLLTGLALMLGAVQEASEPKPLVRKDLLVFGQGEIESPLRDIFRPKPAAGTSRPARPAVRPSPSAAEPEEAPAFALSVSYVGSIKSGGRIIALVLRGGQTLSVSEGDEIAPGYKVLRVTAEAVVVRGPTGETRTFAKQGDRP
jgi:hypothetical protein